MKICFVLLHAYPVVEPDAPGLFGGSETRAVTLAKGLVRYTSHEICFVVRNPHLKRPRVIDGVTYIPWRDFWTEIRAHVAEHIDIKVLPRIRIKRWSWKLLWEIPLLVLSHFWRKKYHDPRREAKVFQEINADLYCSFGINAHAVRTVFNAQQMSRPSLLFLGHDMDLDERYYPGSTYISPYGDRAEPSYWVLKNADQIIAQTEMQQQLLKSRFDRECKILANPFDTEGWTAQANYSQFENPWGSEKYILWIGRAEEVHKKPSRFVELANLCPSHKFLMIMNPSDPDIDQQIKQRAPKNLKIIHSVPFSQMPGVFRHSQIFVNTSTREGFPNVFLQAIASQIPVISYEVGEQFLNKSRAGICVHTNVNLVQKILDDHSLAKTDSQIALEYLRENYLCSSVCSRLDISLQEIFQTFHSKMTDSFS